MIYVVNVDVEVEAANADLAEDLVMDGLQTVETEGLFFAVRDVKEVL